MPVRSAGDSDTARNSEAEVRLVCVVKVGSIQWRPCEWVLRQQSW